MTNQPEKFDLRSHDIAANKQAALRAAFPEAFTESGRIDFERLKLALGETIDSGKERYGMNWSGKADCFKTIQQPGMATLVTCASESCPPLPFTQPLMDAKERELKAAERNPQNIGLIAYGKVVVDAKVVERITDHERGQMINYLRITRLPIGVILNFKRAKLEWERLVLSDNSRSSASIRGSRP